MFKGFYVEIVYPELQKSEILEKFLKSLKPFLYVNAKPFHLNLFNCTPILDSVNITNQIH